MKTRLGFKLVSFFFNGLCYTNKIQIQLKALNNCMVFFHKKIILNFIYFLVVAFLFNGVLLKADEVKKQTLLVGERLVWDKLTLLGFLEKTISLKNSTTT